MSDQLATWQARRPGLQIRYTVALALALHLAILWWWRTWHHPEPEAAPPALRVRLEWESPPAFPGEPLRPAPDRNIDRTPRPQPGQPEAKPAAPSTATGLPPVRTRIAPTPAQPELPSAAEILGRLDKYRLIPTPVPDLTTARPPARILGQAPSHHLVEDHLDDPLPELPFADTPLEVPFYAFGPKGDMQRFRDAITKEFGFKTKYGTKVQCVWAVLVVACAWD